MYKVVKIDKLENTLFTVLRFIETHGVNTYDEYRYFIDSACSHVRKRVKPRNLYFLHTRC